MLSNSIRVIKTTRQTHASSVSYSEAVHEVLRTDGPRKPPRASSPALPPPRPLTPQRTHIHAHLHPVCAAGGLFCRGLGTKLAANALQSALFAVVWKLAEAELAKVL